MNGSRSPLAILTFVSLIGLTPAACATSAPSTAPASASASVASKAAPAASTSAAPAPSLAAASKPATTASTAPALSASAAASGGAAAGTSAKIAGHEQTLKLAKPLPALSPAVTVKARVGNSTTTAPFWYALDRGYFDQLGIKFEVVNITQASDIVGPLTTGQIDVAGAAGGPGIYNAVNRGLGVTAEADNGKMIPGLTGAAVVVKHGNLASYGKDWCALKGKTIGGVDNASNLYGTLVKALETCNLTIKDVRLNNPGFPLLNQALANGAVDVGIQVEPFVTAGVAQGQLDVWRAVEDAWPNQQMNYLLYSPEFAKQTNAALRFMVAYVAGIRDYNTALAPGGNKREFADLIAAHLGGSANTYLAINPTGIDKSGQIDLASTKEEIQIFQQAGTIPAGDVNLGWIKTDLLQQAQSYLIP